MENSRVIVLLITDYRDLSSSVNADMVRTCTVQLCKKRFVAYKAE
jgi:hypothetical protein